AACAASTGTGMRASGPSSHRSARPRRASVPARSVDSRPRSPSRGADTRGAGIGTGPAARGRRSGGSGAKDDGPPLPHLWARLPARVLVRPGTLSDVLRVLAPPGAPADRSGTASAVGADVDPAPRALP